MSEEVENDGQGGWSRWWLVLLGVASIIIGYAAYRVTLFAAVDNSLAALAEKGYPTTVDELEQWKSRGENAAPLYLKAFSEAFIKPADDPPGDLPFVSSRGIRYTARRLSKQTWREAGAYLDRKQKALELLHRAADRPDCFYPMGVRSVRTSNVIRYAGRAARLLALQAGVRASEGRPRAAARSLTAGLAAADSLRRMRLLRAQRERAEALRVVAGATRTVLAHAPVPAEDLAVLQEALRKVDRRTERAVEQGLAGTLCLRISQGRHLQRRKLRRSMAGWPLAAALTPRILPVFYRWSGLRELDELNYIGDMRELLGAWKAPPGERMKRLSRGSARSFSKPGDHWYGLRLVGRPGWSATNALTVLDWLTAVRAARTAAAVERFRLEQGRLPDELRELVPDYLEAVPRDPCDGKPLRYGRTDEGYTIYGVGSDGKDDGGDFDPTDEQADPDVTFPMVVR